MSLPNIPDITPNINLCRYDVVNFLLASIAMQETSLSHIMNAEGEKIQCILAKNRCNYSGKEILEVNDSVERVLERTQKIEELLIQKMKLIKDFM